ncbi:MAG: ABC transporter permease [Acidimicrobiaceae bacterium]|nr:ABC transporter permease [Acidimicrobiaceae bacterium]
MLGLVVLMCYLGPYVFSVPSPINGSIISANMGIGSPGHLLGTDPVGNDIFSRLLYGGRVSIEVGLGTNIIGMSVGGLIGIIAAYRGGLVETIIMRILDVLIAFPSLVLTLAVAEALGPGELHVIYALAFFSVPAFARLSRAQALRLRELDFVLAARLSGNKSFRTIVGHIVPNVAPQLLTFSCLGISVVILIEAALSFLGLGVRPPAPSWGDMISQGQQYLATNPNLVLVPSICLFITAASLNLLGDGLRARWSAR